MIASKNPATGLLLNKGGSSGFLVGLQVSPDALWCRMQIEDFYAQSLQIEDPWKVKEVRILPDERTVEVHVECGQKVTWADPETSEPATVHDWRERRWRHLDTCQFETWVIAKVPRIKLSNGKILTAKVPWAQPHGRFTVEMERRIIDTLLACKSISAAAKLLSVSHDQIDGLMNRAVQRGLSRRELEPLELVGIDEKAIRKRHRYATILNDLISGVVIEVSEGRSKDATKAMIEALPKPLTESIEAVAMDMWKGFIGAVEECLPETAIVFDRFHIKAHLNDSVDQVRRKEHRRLSGEGNEILKGQKFQFLKAHQDLREKASATLRAILREQLDTVEAWRLKEAFDHFWGYRQRGSAMAFLYEWIDKARATGLSPMIKVANMIEEHFAGIMNYITFPITNAASEGINSRIQSLKSDARGLPNFERFRIRVLFFLGGLKLHAV